MIPIDGQPILTAAQLHDAEARHGDLGALMERAGAGVADAVRRLSRGAEALIICGPGNNGGDGYVAARILAQHGHPVRVTALTPPRTALARQAAATFAGPVSFYTTGDQARRDQPAWNRKKPAFAPILVDALFGTGGREDYDREPWIEHHRNLYADASYRIAVDLPLGVTAAGECLPLDQFPGADLTLAMGALKPAHVLPRSAARCGRVRLIDLGLDLTQACVRVICRPARRAPDFRTHKYMRGMVGVVAGAMPGAAELAAVSAARAGAGYVAIFGEARNVPSSIVHRPLSREALSDARLDAIVIGPGLGRDDDARNWVEWLVKDSGVHLIIDGDALHLLDPAWLERRPSQVVLTPHEGEHRALTARLPRVNPQLGDPFGKSMAEAKAFGGANVVVTKGATTIVADYAGARVAPGGNPWLSTAGSGDVLAGAIAAMVASRRHVSWPLIEAVAAGVWLHAEAARQCGASFIADDLAGALTAARAAL
jgi:hydroxyethylthiazole kinase-like uncharacterized protein yjeF